MNWKHFYLKKIILKLMCIILINSCIIFQINFLRFILINFKRVVTNYLYVYQTNLILKN